MQFFSESLAELKAVLSNSQCDSPVQYPLLTPLHYRMFWGAKMEMVEGQEIGCLKSQVVGYAVAKIPVRLISLVPDLCFLIR